MTDLGAPTSTGFASSILVKRALRLEEQQAVSGSYSDLLLHGAAE